jgi:hypothetical protein
MKIFYISDFFEGVILSKFWYVWKYIELYKENNRIYLY